MIICEVIGNVWATRKKDELSGEKLMVVRRIEESESRGHFVAVDCVGAGVNERVLVATGSSARVAINAKEAPIDAAIIGIIDEVKIEIED